jgi:hypothetical protein
MGLHLAGCKVTGDSASSAKWVAEILALLAHFVPATYDYPHYQGSHRRRGSRTGSCFAGNRGNREQVLSELPLVL